MNVSTSNDLTSTAMSLSQAQSTPIPPPGSGEAGPSTRVAALEPLGGALSDGAKDALFAEAGNLENAGASFEEIKAFVSSELEAGGVDLSSGSQRSGQLVDMMA